ncbi:MAG: glycosyltransferase family 4 protein, partial [Chloroflexota bacterium]|nr:glycosyltransferase family 4 protein [Chloroflexota bacterium]
LIPLLRLLRPRARVAVLAYGKEVEQPLSLPARLGLRCAHTVLYISESTQRYLVEQQGVELGRTAMLTYGFDPPTAAGVSQAAGMPGRLILLSVSRLSFGDRYKGIDTTIDALPALIDRYPEICYVVVGDGDDRPRLTQLARDRGVEHHVRFTGEVSDAELAEQYEQCHIYVLPSSHEGLGIVYLEAMARGKPVIGVHAGGVADVVIHEVNGLLVPRRESALVEQALHRLAGNQGLCARLGAWGRDHTVPSFSTERMERAAREVLLAQAR